MCCEVSDLGCQLVALGVLRLLFRELVTPKNPGSPEGMTS